MFFISLFHFFFPISHIFAKFSFFVCFCLFLFVFVCFCLFLFVFVCFVRCSRYTDAGNEHPLEQVIGLTIVWMTLHFVRLTVGVHVVTILLHFILYAALALLVSCFVCFVCCLFVCLFVCLFLFVCCLLLLNE